MEEIWPYLLMENSRSTDFSYGGVLMWVDYFNYKYCIIADTLFIKGFLEDDLSVPAFSLPIGRLPIETSAAVIANFCRNRGIKTEFSAIPESAVGEFMEIPGAVVKELKDWGDYLYDAAPLATLSGKKMSKKRNRFNKFQAEYPGYEYSPITTSDGPALMEMMESLEAECDPADKVAKAERELTRKMIGYITGGNPHLLGGKIVLDGKVIAFTIGDTKLDTLYIHIEKALRSYDGAYEAINTLFARSICEADSEIKFINREDDAGLEGLRLAKQSYHPIEVLKKFNVAIE